jgi:hypothetical protein
MIISYYIIYNNHIMGASRTLFISGAGVALLVMQGFVRTCVHVASLSERRGCGTIIIHIIWTRTHA